MKPKKNRGSEEPTKGGRAALSIISRFRTSLWAHQLLSRTGATPAQLDGMLLEKGMTSTSAIRDRVMFRATRLGVIPQAEPGSIRDVITTAENLFPQSSDDYRHRIWDALLDDETPSINQLDAINDELMVRIDVCKPRLANLAELPLIEAGAKKISDRSNLDALLILAIQCRLAILRSRFGEAQIYLDALATCSKLFDDAMDLPYFNGFFYCLLVRRIVHNDRSEIDFRLWPRKGILGNPAKEEDCEDDSDLVKKKKEDLRNKRWFSQRTQMIGPMSLYELKPQPGTPIVERDERLQWLEDNWWDILGELVLASKGGKSTTAQEFPRIFEASRLWNVGASWTVKVWDDQIPVGKLDWRDSIEEE